MLPKEQSEQLSKLGFNVEELSEAIKKEEEVKITIPELVAESTLTGYLKPEQKEEYRRNVFEEGKNAMSEIFAKNYKSKYKIEMEGKNLDEVVEAINAAALKKGNSKELASDFEALQNKYRTLETERDAMKETYEREKFMYGVQNELAQGIEAKTVIPLGDLVSLYTMQHEIKNENGSAVVLRAGQVIKNNLQSPIPPKEHFKMWLDEKKYIVKDGMGGGNKRGGSGSQSKFDSVEQVMQYAQENGLDPMGPEISKIITENNIRS